MKKTTYDEIKKKLEELKKVVVEIEQTLDGEPPDDTSPV